ncbi:hypothetical protein PUN28_014973 [Cardiocondyla obscurior]|uniref:Uncharacterized protein n=1 Tax=Cardiocondyla obscurior TaxID=286306 RepID=A0AAW2EZS1_9HYME
MPWRDHLPKISARESHRGGRAKVPGLSVTNVRVGRLLLISGGPMRGRTRRVCRRRRRHRRSPPALPTKFWPPNRPDRSRTHVPRTNVTRQSRLTQIVAYLIRRALPLSATSFCGGPS